MLSSYRRCFYQAIVRKEVVENDLPHKGLSYYDFKDQQTDVENIIKKKLQINFGHLHLSQRYPFNITKYICRGNGCLKLEWKLSYRKRKFPFYAIIICIVKEGLGVIL